MMDQKETGGGISVLDGGALVMGAAVASVHIRGVIRDRLTQFDWVLVLFTFTWVALTATGPFLFLVRRFARPMPGYPKVGDRLWGLLGLPWLATAILRSSASGPKAQIDGGYALALTIGLAAASLIAVQVLWSTWIMVSPEEAGKTASAPWTNRVGLVLSIAWPLQCGLGMVVID
jgi:hypothetical protein